MKQILYIDDNRTSQMIALHILEQVAGAVAVFTTEEATRKLAERKFDLIIADYQLANGTPIEFIQQLRERMTTEELPVLLVSASMDKVMLSEALAAGVNDCHSKPLNKPSFRQMVEKMLLTPYVRECEDRFLSITVVSWTCKLHHYLHCPELHMTFDGDSYQDADAKLSAYLETVSSKGIIFSQFEAIFNPKIHTKVVKLND
ncbi:MAG: response regulator [Verrucomicrobiota bacterium]|nr:response regulator [Verrucomicrobiota bacterium]